MNKKEVINFYLENGTLLSPELIDELSDIEIPLDTSFSVINKDIIKIIKEKISLDVDNFEKAVVMREKYRNTKLYQKFQEYILNEQASSSESRENKKDGINKISETDEKDKRDKKDEIESDSSSDISKQREETKLSKEEFLKINRINIIHDYNEKSQKRTVNDFVGHFNARYKELEKILKQRQELQNLTSVARINSKKEKENVAIIGYVYDKGLTKNGNIMFTLEDPTGFVKAVVTRNKEEVFRMAEEIQLDEVIGLTGTYDGLIFTNNLFLPDIPLTKELKKSPEEGYFLVITDPQIGSKLFLEKEFLKLIEWVNGRAGSEDQKTIAENIKYIFLVGDLVDGVGIYPDQEYDLSIIDINDQYKKCAEYLQMLPSKVPIIVCPGNHDVGRISEPQPRFKDEYTKPVWELPNVVAVSNPSLINIFSGNGFEGFDVLLYHGYSFFYYFANVPSIRQNGGPKRPDLVMKYLLQRRHLAPSHTSSLYVPDPKRDPLIIDKVPDFFFSGHIHRSSVINYKNVTCINASCWVSKSDEQERRGLDPQPARAFVINMQTREVKVMNFSSREDNASEDRSNG